MKEHIFSMITILSTDEIKWIKENCEVFLEKQNAQQNKELEDANDDDFYKSKLLQLLPFVNPNIAK